MAKEGDKIGSFVVLENLGKGTFGAVYKVTDEARKNTYALKTVQLTKPKKKSTRESLKLSSQREVDIGIISGIYSPYLVKYHSIFKVEDTFCIVMELCASGCLEDLIQKHIAAKTHFSEEVIIEIMYQMASALFELHSHKIIHRDLKSDNVFVGMDGNFRLGDYGVGKALDDEDGVTSTVVGTPLYIAPEILEGQHLHSYPVDIWSLGVLLYYCCMFQFPFVAENANLIIPIICSARYTPIPAINKGGFYSQELIDLIGKMLIKNVQERITADTILMNPIFGKYLRQIISKDVVDVFKKNKIPLKDVTRDPELVVYLKWYKQTYKDSGKLSPEELKKLEDLIAKMQVKVTRINKQRAEKEARKKARRENEDEDDEEEDEDD